ncbi:MAG: hypothetical protein SGPRY_004406, partial [Prymnesium sp.]
PEEHEPTGLFWKFARIEAVLKAPQEEWAKICVTYNMERRLTASSLSDTVAGLLGDEPDSLSGEESELGFLFLYDLMRCVIEREGEGIEIN